MPLVSIAGRGSRYYGAGGGGGGGAGSNFTSFALAPSSSGTLQPWTMGHPFKEGDIPSGQYLTSDASSFQCDPQNYWDDGSLKFAVLSGRSTFVADTDKTITLSATTSAPSGTALTESDLTTAMGAGDVSVAFSGATTGSVTVTLSSLVGVAATIATNTSNGLIRTRIAGPVMSEFHYRKQVGSDASLRVYFYVRIYAGGFIEVETVVENGYMYASGGLLDKTYNVTLTVNGSTIYSASSVNHYHTTRWAQTAWFAGGTADPAGRNVHQKINVSYWKSTKLIPNYTTGTSPQSGTMAAYTTTYTPFSLVDMPDDTNGNGEFIGLITGKELRALSGDVRGVRSAIANAYAPSAYKHRSIRDESTGKPLRYSDHPGACLGYGGMDSFSTAEGGAPIDAGYSSSTHETANTKAGWNDEHTPGFGYLAYLLTGRYYLMESVQMAATSNYLLEYPGPSNHTAGRRREYGVLSTGRTDRAHAWHMRTQAFAACITPDADNLQTEFANCLYRTIEFESEFMDNNLGILSAYTNHEFNGGSSIAMWQTAYKTQVLGFSWDIASHLMSSGRQTTFQAVRDYAYTWIVHYWGGGASTDWSYLKGGEYYPNISATVNASNTVPRTWITQRADMGAWYTFFFGTPNPGTTSGGTITSQDTGSTLSPSCYWAQNLPAMAYAVDHAATDAATNWARVQTASNFPNFSGSSFQDEPRFIIVGR